MRNYCSVNFYLSKLSIAKFSILYDISLVRDWKRKLKLITLGSERVKETYWSRNPEKSLKLSSIFFLLFPTNISSYLCCISSSLSTYVILAPSVFRPGMNYKLRVSILKASSAVNVNAAILEEKSKTALATGSGTFNAGLVYTKFMHLQSFLLCVS